MPTMEELKIQLLKQLGKDPDLHVYEPQADNQRSKDERVFSAEGTLYSLQWPLKPRATKTCKGCGHNFLTEYHSVAYCSNLCRKDELAKFGIDYKDEPLKKSYGGMTPPRVIPPDALEAMASVLRQANYTVLNPKEVEVSLPDQHELEQTQKKSEIPDEHPKTQIKEVLDEFDPFAF